MKTIELFCGTKSFSKVMSKNGYSTYTIDIEPKFNPDVVADILNDFLLLSKDIDIWWASPPCQTFSVASIGHYWDKGKPKNEKARQGIALLDRTIKILSGMKPKYWFIENPRGMMRTVIDEIFKKYEINEYVRRTVTYCQYGAKIMKPTDIWTNLKEWEGKKCKNGMKCHIPCPRGVNTGVQGMKDATARGEIPPALFEEILSKIPC